MCEREAGPSVLGIWDVYRSAQEGVVMRETAFYTTTTAKHVRPGGNFDPGGGVGHDGQALARLVCIITPVLWGLKL